ncbi:MAG TPA: hypothetical protein VHB21_04585 [Minicystis sp.]|nr:hypothetical protein [Minicystis sp.]
MVPWHPKMPITFEAVDALAKMLPGVTVGVKWGNRTWMVNGRGFAWERPFSKADLKRFGDAPVPAGEILAVRVDGLDEKEALLEAAPPGFFTIPHFDGYAAVLVALRKARASDVRAAIRGAHAAMSAGPPRVSKSSGRRRSARRA